MNPQEFREHIAKSCGFNDDWHKFEGERFPSILESMEQQRRYWLNKRGLCQGCNAEIAVEDQYCLDCETFLIESMEEELQ